MKGRVALTAAAVVAMGAGAAIPGAGATERASKAPKKATVNVVDYSFEKPRVTIKKGGTVTWKFKQGQHNVVGKGFESAIKSSGKYKKTFKKKGAFDYVCTLHQPGMDGTVKVK